MQVILHGCLPISVTKTPGKGREVGLQADKTRNLGHDYMVKDILLKNCTIILGDYLHRHVVGRADLRLKPDPRSRRPGIVE
jgi:hypothetical protein